MITHRLVRPDGFVVESGDCDDDQVAVYPGAPEEDCTDPVDYNCDGSTGYADLDGDGTPACNDCDDTDPDVNPYAAEVCNDGVDDNCDGSADEPGSVSEQIGSLMQPVTSGILQSKWSHAPSPRASSTTAAL